MEANRVYKTFKDPAFPLIVYRCPRNRVLPNFVNIHWHITLELIYVADGSYEVYDENGNYTAHAGGLIILPPQKPHAIRAVSDRSEYWSIHFTPDLITLPEGHFFQQEFVEPLRTGSLQMPRFLEPEQVTDGMRQALSRLAYSREKWERFQSVMYLCAQLLPLCSRTETQLPIPAGHPAVQECMRYINTNYAAKLTLEELAEYVHLHPNYLSTLFKKDCGQSVFKYLTHQRIYAARELLSNRRLSVAQVAELTGFTSPDFFCRKFKEIIGTTPNAYRKNDYNP